MTILMYVGGNHKIHWHAQQSAVGKGNYEDAPESEHLHHP